MRLITRVGNDADGGRFQQMLGSRGFRVTDIQTDPDHLTGVVDITLDNRGVPAFSIREDVAYDHLTLDQLPRDPDWADARLIYFGSLIQRSPAGYEQLKTALERRPAAATCFCDLNLRPPHYKPETVIQCLHFADVLKLNENELEEIGRLLGLQATGAALTEYLMDWYHIAVIAITRGARGSTIIHGGDRIDTPASPVDPVVDTVGAGDGYTAVLALGMLQRQPLEKVAATAGDFAAGICRLAGAVPDDLRFYDPWKPFFGDHP